MAQQAGTVVINFFRTSFSSKSTQIRTCFYYHFLEQFKMFGKTSEIYLKIVQICEITSTHRTANEEEKSASFILNNNPQTVAAYNLVNLSFAKCKEYR